MNGNGQWRILWTVVGVFLLVVVVFSLASIFSPGFRDGGAAIVGVILGAMTTFTTGILTIIWISRGMQNGAGGAKPGKENNDD